MGVCMNGRRPASALVLVLLAIASMAQAGVRRSVRSAHLRPEEPLVSVRVRPKRGLRDQLARGTLIGEIVNDEAVAMKATNASSIVTLHLPRGMLRKVIFKPKSGEKDAGHGIAVGTFYRREIAVSQLDEALSLNLVPTTVELTGKQGIGSAQLFSDRSTLATRVDPKKISLDRVSAEKLRAFDYLIGNSDRSWRNLMVKKSRGVYLPVAIDNGYTLPTAVPARFLWPHSLLRGQVGPLTSEAKQFIAAIDPQRVARVLIEAGIERKAVVQVLRRLAHLQTDPSFLEIRRPGWGPYQMTLAVEKQIKNRTQGLSAEQLKEIERIVRTAAAEAVVD